LFGAVSMPSWRESVAPPGRACSRSRRGLTAAARRDATKEAIALAWAVRAAYMPWA